MYTTIRTFHSWKLYTPCIPVIQEHFQLSLITVPCILILGFNFFYYTFEIKIITLNSFFVTK